MEGPMAEHNHTPDPGLERLLGPRGREVVLEAERWPAIADERSSAHEQAEQSELLRALKHAVDTTLTPHQRRVLVALALNGVPIDVLAERLNTNRGALYKTLHDARRKLHKHLDDCALSLDTWLEEVN